MSNEGSSEVDKFVGNFVSDGDWNGKPEHMASWFPTKGIAMTIVRIDVLDLKGKPVNAYAKVTISSSPAKRAIETAVYRLENGNLVARNIELHAGLLVDETLVALVDPNSKAVTGIRHDLEFSDGTAGRWTCKTH